MMIMPLTSDHELRGLSAQLSDLIITVEIMLRTARRYAVSVELEACPPRAVCVVNTVKAAPHTKYKAVLSASPAHAAVALTRHYRMTN